MADHRFGWLRGGATIRVAVDRKGFTMHATDIIAYTYRADVWHPDCVLVALYHEGRATLAALEMDVEDALRQIGESEGIDTDDPYSFDSGDFPKLVFADVGVSECHDDYCALCHNPIVQDCVCEFCVCDTCAVDS